MDCVCVMGDDDYVTRRYKNDDYLNIKQTYSL